MSHDQTQNPPERESFGAMLRYYREHIAERIRPLVPGQLASIQLTAKDVARCMSAANVNVSAAVYTDIEQDVYLPKQPYEFLEAAASCLGIEKGSADFWNLMDHLVIEVLKHRVGPEAASAYREDLRAVRQLRRAGGTVGAHATNPPRANPPAANASSQRK